MLVDSVTGAWLKSLADVSDAFRSKLAWRFIEGHSCRPGL